jgi:hypothetical protein
MDLTPLPLLSQDRDVRVPLDSLERQSQGLEVDGGNDLQRHQGVLQQHREKHGVIERPSPSGEGCHENWLSRFGFVDRYKNIVAWR